MAKNKNKEKPKQNKGQGGDMQAAATDVKMNNQKGQGVKKDNPGKDFYA